MNKVSTPAMRVGLVLALLAIGWCVNAQGTGPERAANGPGALSARQHPLCPWIQLAGFLPDASILTEYSFVKTKAAGGPSSPDEIDDGGRSVPIGHKSVVLGMLAMWREGGMRAPLGSSAAPSGSPLPRQWPQRLRGGKDSGSGKIEEAVDLEGITVRELVERVKDLKSRSGVSLADRVVIAYQVRGEEEGTLSFAGGGPVRAMSLTLPGHCRSWGDRLRMRRRHARARAPRCSAFVLAV